MHLLDLTLELLLHSQALLVIDALLYLPLHLFFVLLLSLQPAHLLANALQQVTRMSALSMLVGEPDVVVADALA